MAPSRTDIPQSLGLLVEEQGRALGDRPFIIAAETGTTLSYAQYRGAVAAFAGAMVKAGATPGARIAVALGNGLNAAVAILGIIAAGGVAVPLNPRLTAEEIDWILGHSHAQLFVTDQFHAGGLPSVRTNVEVRRIAGPETDNPFLTHRLSHAPSPENLETTGANADDAALLLYTSGTTGHPKGVVLSHTNLLSNASAVCASHGLGATDAALCILPLFHINGLVFTLITPLLSGGRVIMARRFKADDFWSWVQNHRATWFSGVPTILSLLLSHDTPPQEAVATLRFARSASASLPMAVLGEFEQRFGIPVIESYGITEAAGQVAANPLPPGQRKSGSVGLAVGIELRLIDGTGTPVSDGTVGEVALRGPSLFQGYLYNREANEAAFVNGWFRTGDLGYLDSDGYLFLTGRKKELINRAGEKISPREVEEVIHRLPEVEVAGVVGIPDQLYGEEVVAFVTLRPGATLGSDVVQSFCRAHLARFKVPREVLFIPELPKGPSGKIQRRRLIEVYDEIASRKEKETEHETHS